MLANVSEATENLATAHLSQASVQPGRPELRACREEIDRIDDAILASLDQRARAVQRLAAIKRQHGIAVFDSGREKQVMAHVSQHDSALPVPLRRAIFTTILEQMRAWQLDLNSWTE